MIARMEKEWSPALGDHEFVVTIRLHDWLPLKLHYAKWYRAWKVMRKINREQEAFTDVLPVIIGDEKVPDAGMIRALQKLRI